MEFDFCSVNVAPTLFGQIYREFRNAGYKPPRLVFWNVNSRTGAIPVRENDLGVALVSGFSVNVFNMVLSNELNPYKNLTNILDDKRYEAVERLLGA